MHSQNIIRCLVIFFMFWNEDIEKSCKFSYTCNLDHRKIKTKLSNISFEKYYTKVSFFHHDYKNHWNYTRIYYNQFIFLVIITIRLTTLINDKYIQQHYTPIHYATLIGWVWCSARRRLRTTHSHVRISELMMGRTTNSDHGESIVN